MNVLKLFLTAVVLWCASDRSLIAAVTNPGDQVLVVYNSRIPDSKRVAEHYASKRNVPAAQVIGLKMPETEAITRADYRDSIERPLRKLIEKKKWIEWSPTIKPATAESPGLVLQMPVKSTIRYVVLCYGVPLRIVPDGTLVEKIPEKTPPEFRRNGAAVDSELCLLPRDPQTYMLAGPVRSPYYQLTNAAILNPTNGLLMVTRLDGPTAAIAQSLVDKAMQAEVEGLWGRAYFDSRGITNGAYKQGDDWILNAAKVVARVGYETLIDTNDATLPRQFPLSQAAMYVGWYDTHVSGPFTRTNVEFMPGAFAYHLHSYSAESVRTATLHWVGPLLARGATVTMGCVDEPYLSLTPDIGTFMARWIFGGFTFGEAAYTCQLGHSWQTTVVGDPLYRPFGKQADQLHTQLTITRSKMLEWSILRAINQNIMLGEPVSKFITVLEREPLTKDSAVLQEKLGELYLYGNKLLDSLEAFLTAHKLSHSPQQRARLALRVQKHLILFGREREAFTLLQTLLDENADYPDKLAIYEKMLPLAKKLKLDADVDKILAQILILTPPPPPPATNATNSVKPPAKP